MKRIRYAVILLLGLSMAMMASCTKDPDNGGGNNGGSYQDKIVGEWQMTKISEYYYDSIGTLVYKEEQDIPVEYWDEYKFKFFSNGTVRMADWWFQKSNAEYYNVPYLIDGNTLYIGDGVVYGTDEYAIRELTNSSMVWETEYFGHWSSYWDDDEQCFHEGFGKTIKRFDLKKSELRKAMKRAFI